MGMFDDIPSIGGDKVSSKSLSDLVTETPNAGMFDDIKPDNWKPPEDIGGGEAFTAGLGQGATMNFSDEAASGLKALTSDQDYSTSMEHAKTYLDKAREKHPWLFTAGELGGALLPGMGAAKAGLTLTGRALSPLARYGAAAAEGLGWGAGYGVGSGDGVKDRAVKGGIGAVGGALAGPVVEGVSGALQRVAKDVPAAAKANIDLGKEFDVKPLRGQATGDIQQQAFEEAARNGAKPGATDIIRNADEANRLALEKSADKIGLDVAGGKSLATNPYDAGQAIRDSVEARKAQLHTTGNQQYADAESYSTFINPDTMDDLRKGVNDAVQPWTKIVGAKLAPRTQLALDKITEFAQSTYPRTKPPFMPHTTPQAPVARKPVSLMEMNDVRKFMNTLKPDRGSEDERALGQVKSAFDTWLKDSVDNKLFSGDPRGLDELKKATDTWHDYLSITRPKSGDDAGNVIKKISDGSRDPIEVSNWLLGTSQVGNAGMPVRVVNRIQKMFGPKSDEMNTLRQAMWAKLTKQPTGKTAMGNQALSQRIFEFTNGKSKPLADALFDTNTLNLMRRYAQTAKMLVPDPAATNPSKTSYGMQKLFGSLGSNIATLIGFHFGGIDAAVAAKFGTPLLEKATNYSRAKAATMPPLPQLTPGATAMAGPLAGELGDNLNDKFKILNTQPN